MRDLATTVKAVVALVVVVVYAIERVAALQRAWKNRTGKLMDAVERQSNLGPSASVVPTAKTMLPPELRGDPELDAILDDSIDPKDTRRVSRKRRALRFGLRLLPLVSRILDRDRG